MHFVFPFAVSARSGRSLAGEPVAGGRTDSLAGQVSSGMKQMPQVRLNYAKTVRSALECGPLSLAQGGRKRSKHRSRKAHRAKMFSELRFPARASETSGSRAGLSPS